MTTDMDRGSQDDRLNDQRLRLALEASGMGTFLWYPQEDRTEADVRMLELFGLPSDGSISLASALASLIHPDDVGRYGEAVGHHVVRVPGYRDRDRVAVGVRCDREAGAGFRLAEQRCAGLAGRELQITASFGAEARLGGGCLDGVSDVGELCSPGRHLEVVCLRESDAGGIAAALFGGVQRCIGSGDQR